MVYHYITSHMHIYMYLITINYSMKYLTLQLVQIRTSPSPKGSQKKITERIFLIHKTVMFTGASVVCEVHEGH